MLRHLIHAPPAAGPLPVLCFLHGYSEAAPLQPDLWTALWAVDPTRVPQQAPAQPVWLSAGALARSRRGAFVEALGLGAHGERVWADDGETTCAGCSLSRGASKQRARAPGG
jgi:hypothetical protein